MPALRDAMQASQREFLELAAAKGLPAPKLGPPASEADLALVEEQRGELPPLVRELLLAADGWANVPATEPALTWFSCRELLGAEYAAFVAKVRKARGFARERDVQRGFIVGGNDNHALTVTPEPARQLVIYRLQPRTRLFWGAPVHFLEVWMRAAALETKSAAAPPRRAADPLAQVDEAIEAFNYPNEMGDDVHDSVERLSEILAELPKGSPHLAALRRLLSELERGYTGQMRFGAARRRGDRIEVQLDAGWTPVEALRLGR